MIKNTLTMAPIIPWWVMLALLGIGVGLTVAQYRRVRDRLDKKRAFIVSALRLSAIVLILTFALNPSILVNEEHPIPPTIAILLDTADSMGQIDSGKRTPRLEAARVLLMEGKNPLLTSLNKEYDVKIYGLADSLKPLMTADLAQLKAHGNKGDASKALNTLNKTNSVAVLLSDGNVKWDGNRTTSTPMVTVPLGLTDDYKDILIKEVKAPTLAFRDREVFIDLTVKSYGYADVTYPVFLEDTDTILSGKNIHPDTDKNEVTVSLSFIPKTVGRKDLSISIPQQAGENIVTNNQINLSIKVVRDKTRILMVSGTPSMNYRFMRTALKSDPSIDLLSFIILRTPADIMNVRPHEQSLIPFPVDTLFIDEVNNFDLILFDNFNYAYYLKPDHLESIRGFINNGGGLGIIGGPGLFNEGRLGLSPLGDILPFRFMDRQFYKRDKPINVQMSRSGENHPLMRFFGDFGKENGDHPRLWKEMPPLDGFNPVEAKHSAKVLLESESGIPWPILTVSDYGAGRVLGLATDYAWKWYMGMVAKGKGSQPYLQLIHAMVRWLTQDPSLSPIQVILPQVEVFTNQEVDIRVRFLGENISERSDLEIKSAVFDSEGTQMTSTLKPDDVPGEYLLSFQPDKGGIYRLQVETPNEKIEESIVISGPLENLDAAPNPEQLKKIAASTGGKFVSQTNELFATIETLAKKAKISFIEEKRSPVWATPYVMLLTLGLLSAEWYLRRRWGLM